MREGWKNYQKRIDVDPRFLETLEYFWTQYKLFLLTLNRHKTFMLPCFFKEPEVFYHWAVIAII